jgi:hypothetical protein
MSDDMSTCQAHKQIQEFLVIVNVYTGGYWEKRNTSITDYTKIRHLK